jgi:DNA polymerase-4
MSRKILHLDLDAFFCAVEEQHDASLRGRPFAVGGRPDQRGVVASCSYAARRFGVRSAMPMSRAVRLCPGLIIVPHRHQVYGQISRRVMALLEQITPLVEQISIDEAFLDVTMRPEPASVLALQIQQRINNELELPCSIGVASNKLVAKIATNTGKARARGDGPPNAILAVPPGEEAAFLAPLPARELWGVGPKTEERLAALDIQTIGDIARWPPDDLARRFGRLGEELSQRARGIDNRPLETEHEAKSISREITFAEDIHDGSELRRTLRGLSDGVGYRLRRAGLAGTTVRIKLRWSDFTTLTRQQTLRQPTQHDQEIYEVALALFEQNWTPGKPVRLLGVGVSGLGETLRQLSLWDAAVSESEQRLEQVVDELRSRFGDQAVRRASDLYRWQDDEE